MEWEREEKQARELLKKSLTNLEEAMSSDIWGYIREYELGKLDVAKTILQLVIEGLSKDWKIRMIVLGEL